MQSKYLWLALAAMLLGACASTTFMHPAAREVSDQQVATIKDRWGWPLVSIWSDAGRSLVYHRNRDGRADLIKLPPGRYAVEYAAVHRKIAPLWRKDSVELKAGHSYSVRTRACYIPTFSCWGYSYQATLWIEDETTGDVIAGVKWR